MASIRDRAFKKALLMMVLAPLTVLSFSALPQKRKGPNPEPPQQQVEVSTLFPTLTPLEGTNMSQKKVGLRVSLSLAPYELRKAYRRHVTRVNPSFKEALLGCTNCPWAAVTCSPFLSADPDRLKFVATVSNDMSHVFRGSGIYVRFNVAGREASVDKAAWAQLADAIIAPRGEQQIEIFGPAINTLPEKGGTIGLFFDDVVTNTDAAGNVTDRQSFEWYFQFRTEAKKAEMLVPPPVRTWIAPGRELPPCPAPED